MNDRSTGTLATGKAVLSEVRERQITFMAASVAYYAFVSLLPLLTLALVAATVVGGESLAREVVAVAETFLSATGQEEVVEILTDPSGRSSATVVSVVVLLWSGLKVFRALDIAFSIVYDVDETPSLAAQVVEALIGFLAIVVAVEVVLVIGTVLPALSDVPFLGVVSALLALPALTVVFLPLYYFFPDTEVTVREVLPGALIAAVGWTGLQVLFQLYASNAGGFALYGFLGGVLLLVTWLYFGSVVILVGAAVNVVLARRTGGEQSIQARREQTQHE